MSQTWLNAQKAERSYYNLPKTRVKLKKSPYLYNQFILKPGFFVGKNVLEVGSTINSHIHMIDEATELRVGLDPLARFFSSAYPHSAEHVEAMGGKRCPLK